MSSTWAVKHVDSNPDRFIKYYIPKASHKGHTLSYFYGPLKVIVAVSICRNAAKCLLFIPHLVEVKTVSSENVYKWKTGPVGGSKVPDRIPAAIKNHNKKKIGAIGT